MDQPPVDPVRPHSQEAYLYVNNWEPEDDHLLLEYMIIQKQWAEAASKNLDLTGLFIIDAHDELAEESMHWHEAEAVGERIEFLRKGYNTFFFVVHHEGMEWKPRQQYVKAKDVVWHQMIEENEFAIAYCLRDEPEYTNLIRVFEPDTADDDDMGEVVGPSNRN